MASFFTFDINAISYILVLCFRFKSHDGFERKGLAGVASLDAIGVCAVGWVARSPSHPVYSSILF